MLASWPAELRAIMRKSPDDSVAVQNKCALDVVHFCLCHEHENICQPFRAITGGYNKLLSSPEPREGINEP